jgi:hypothetical protein
MEKPQLIIMKLTDIKKERWGSELVARVSGPPGPGVSMTSSVTGVVKSSTTNCINVNIVNSNCNENMDNLDTDHRTLKHEPRSTTEKSPMIPREEGRESESTTELIPEGITCPMADEDNPTKDIDFQIEPVVSYIEGGNWDCKVCSFKSNKEIDLLEHLQRSYKCMIRDTECNICGKCYKGRRGLDVHLSRSKCGQEVELQSTEPQNITPTESTLTNQDKTHSVASRQQVECDKRILANVMEKCPVKWPAMKDDKNWKKLDDVVSAQLNIHDSASKRINILENVVYEEAVNLFGIIEKKGGEKKMASRRQKEIV